MSKLYRKLRLYGDLADEFGEEFEVYAASLVDATNILEANFPGKFYNAMNGKNYHLILGEDIETGDAITTGFLTFRTGRGHYHIVPELFGGKSTALKGVLAIVAAVAIVVTAGGAAVAAGTASMSSSGAVLAGASTSTLFAAGAGTAALGGLTTLGGLTLLGAAIGLGGISTLLAPGVKTDFDDQGEDTTGSFTFGGHANVSYEGVTHPVVYGRVLAGSVTISSSIQIEDYVGSSDVSSFPAGSLGGTVFRELVS